MPILFFEILVVVPNPEQMIAKIGLAVEAELEILVMVLPVMFPVVMVPSPVCNAFTCPPAVKLVRVFDEMVLVAPLTLVPVLIAKMTPPVAAVVKFESVLPVTVDPLPEKLWDMPVIWALPVVILLKVLLEIVFVGPLPPPGPSRSSMPVKALAPVKVTFEKLLRFIKIVAPFGDEAPVLFV